MPKITENSFTFDSKDEQYFYWYCQELIKFGLIEEWFFHPDSYELFNQKNMYGLKKHVYTPDFKILWRQSARKLFLKSSDVKNFFTTRRKESDFSIIEIKPSFDIWHSIREFSINQKWVYAVYNIYVQKVVVKKCFEKTFTPKRYLVGKRKINWKIKTIEEFINS